MWGEYLTFFDCCYIESWENMGNLGGFNQVLSLLCQLFAYDLASWVTLEVTNQSSSAMYNQAVHFSVSQKCNY
jgi:hypothetical protein